MKQLPSLSEVVDCWMGTEGVFEVVASAEATYCESRQALLVQLDVSLRPLDFQPDEDFISARWLPHRDTVLELVPQAKAESACEKAFRAWMEKVRASIPEAGGRRSVDS